MLRTRDKVVGKIGLQSNGDESVPNLTETHLPFMTQSAVFRDAIFNKNATQKRYI